MAKSGVGPSKPQSSRKVKKKKPDPPGSSFSTEESLQKLRQCCRISEAVEFVAPEPFDRANEPPLNHFTTYECFFELCYLWFPVPEPVLRYLWLHGISLGQIMPRGLWHIIGILVRGDECGIDIGVNHFRNFLEIRRSLKPGRYYISNKRYWRIIGGFPSKDNSWDDYFFYVHVDETSVGNDFLNLIMTDWGPLVCDPLPPVPEDIAQTKEYSLPIKLIGRSISRSGESRKRERYLPEPLLLRILLLRRTTQSGEWCVYLSATKRSEPTRNSAGEVPKAVRTNPTDADVSGKTPEIPSYGKGATGSSEVHASGSKGRVVVLGLASRSRPSASVLTKHKGGSTRKRSSSEGDKEKDSVAPKKRRTILIDGEIAPSVVDDAFASATLLSKINNKGFLASINETISGYEADARKDQRRIDEARKDAVMLQTKLDEAERKFSFAMAQAKARIKALETEKKALKDECVKATDMAVRLEESRAKKDVDIASLQRQLTEKNCLHEANIKRAVKSARRDLIKKMRGRLSSAEKNLKDLADTKENELDLAQIDGNLQLIELLKKDDVPTLDAEAEKLKQW
ncbi:uncharacterized protein At3g60930, chloroplastic-like [Eutrema salsugineum]|uniref:uncharacterized protein At3g60930, chloroplastic-like n=1 Tax=Eutrema salsugineum TaxID=72664 RepID=UPI000CED3028|nr:uncharacterized protein At3g60930, chloroplastic-like [Eutrema salsugineum]